MTADVSVVVANYNHAKLLPRCLNAILTQSVRPKEVLVIDDCSSDNSSEIIRQIAKSDTRVRIIEHSQNQGVVPTYNEGIHSTTGEYVFLAAADDYLRPGFFEKLLPGFVQHPNVGLCFAYDSFAYGHDGEIIENPSGWCASPQVFTPEEIAKRVICNLPGHAIICRRAPLVEVGGYLADLKWYSDWFALLTIAFRHGAYHVPESLAVRCLMPGAYSEAARQGPEHHAVLSAVLEKLATEQYQDVKTRFIQSGTASFFGTDLVRAIAQRSDCWHPDWILLGACLKHEQYTELAKDSDVSIQTFGQFYLDLFWSSGQTRTKLGKSEVENLQAQLAELKSQLAPPGLLGKTRWLAGLAKKKLLAMLKR